MEHHLHQIIDAGLYKCRLKTELFRRIYVARHCLRSCTIRKQRCTNDYIIIIVVVVVVSHFYYCLKDIYDN